MLSSGLRGGGRHHGGRGATALQHAGLRGYDDETVHVSAVHNHNTDHADRVHVHQVIRRVPAEVIDVGLPRTRPEVAADSGGRRAASDRQAALVLLMTAQRRLNTPARLAAAQRRVRGRTRRACVRAVVRDFAVGSQSLGELDFALLCRARGLRLETHRFLDQVALGLTHERTA